MARRLRLRVTQSDFGQLRTAQGLFVRFQTTSDIAAWIFLPESIPNLSESDRSRLRIFAKFTHHYFKHSSQDIPDSLTGKDFRINMILCPMLIRLYYSKCPHKKVSCKNNSSF